MSGCPPGCRVDFNINHQLVWGYWQDNDRLITGLGEVCSKNIMIFISTIRNFITEFSLQRVVRFQRINCACENCLTTKIRIKNNSQETDRTQTISWKKLIKKISGHRWKFCFVLIKNCFLCASWWFKQFAKTWITMRGIRQLFTAQKRGRSYFSFTEVCSKSHLIFISSIEYFIWNEVPGTFHSEWWKRLKCLAIFDQFVGRGGGPLKRQTQDSPVYRKTVTLPLIFRKSKGRHYINDEVWEIGKRVWNSWRMMDVKMDTTSNYVNM